LLSERRKLVIVDHSMRKACTISNSEGYGKTPGKNVGPARQLPKLLPWLPHEAWVLSEMRWRYLNGRHVLIRTGQHYDRPMSDIPLEEFELEA
jgi:hypothetical protein